MNTYMEKLLLASSRLENHSIQGLDNINLYNKKECDFKIELYDTESKNYSEPTCYIEANNRKATLLFLENIINTEDGILVYFTKEVFQYLDMNTVLHTYKNGAFVKTHHSNKEEFPFEVNRLHNMHGELIKSNKKCENLKELIMNIFQNINHNEYNNKFKYLDDYHIHYNKIPGWKLVKLKLAPLLDIVDTIKALNHIESFYEPQKKTR